MITLEILEIPWNVLTFAGDRAHKRRGSPEMHLLNDTITEPDVRYAQSSAISAD